MARPTAEESPSAAPWWFRAITGALGALVIVPIVLVTLLAFAWRASEPAWLPGVLLLGEVTILIAVLTIGRRRRKRLFASVHQRRAWSFIALGVTTLPILVAYLFFSQSCSPVDEPAESDPSKKRVAVVGAGAAGIHAAWMLDQAGMDYTVYEATDRIGGHAFSVPFETSTGEILPVDIGFIFGAPRGYEEMKALMAYNGIERVQSSASYSSRVDEEHWATEAPEMLDPEALRFHELADRYVDDTSLNLVPFGWWLRRHGFDDEFRRQYLTPILIVLFVTDEGIYEQSTRFILAMASGKTKWIDFRKGSTGWVVGGGSSHYYDVLSKPLADRIRLQTPVTSVERVDGRVRIVAVESDGTRSEELYDDVILAIPADVARQLLVDRSGFEDLILGQIRYDEAEIVLHTDESVLPRDPNLRRNYNYLQTEDFDGGFELTGIMGRIVAPGTEVTPQPIGTLNPQRPLKDVRESRVWRHHIQDLWHLAVTGELLPKIQGRGQVHYAGDWVKYIGHGPALRTGMNAACRAGAVEDVQPAADTPCMEVTIQDPMPWMGTDAQTVEICGEVGLRRYNMERACRRELRRLTAP